MNISSKVDNLNVAVAEKVLGLHVVETTWGKQKQHSYLSLGEPDWYDDAGESLLHNPLPSYSEDIAAAWEIVDHLVADGWQVKLITSEHGGTDCLITCSANARGRFASDTMEGLNTTAPQAICIAALKAIGASQ